MAVRKLSLPPNTYEMILDKDPDVIAKGIQSWHNFALEQLSSMVVGDQLYLGIHKDLVEIYTKTEIGYDQKSEIM